MVQQKERHVGKSATLSDQKIRRRRRIIEKQMAELETKADEHRNRIVIYRNAMTEHTRLMEEQEAKRQILLQLETQIKTRKFEVPQIDEKRENLKNEHQNIQSKLEGYEDICRKIGDNSKTVQRLIQEMESLHKKITHSKVNKQQRNMELKSQVEEIQQMRKKFNYSPDANNMVELLDNVEDLHDEVEKWAERFQSLSVTVCRWKEKNSSLENSVEELGANLSLRDQKALDIEAHIDFLKLMLLVEDKMNDHKVKAATWRRKNDVQKQPEEELSDCFQAQKKKMDDHQTTFLTKYKHTKEELKKVEHRKRSNSNTVNRNIEHVFKNTEHKQNKIEESENRNKADIAEIESKLEELKSEINLKMQSRN